MPAVAKQRLNGATNGLTVKQQLWLDAYLETNNATEACRRAGYRGNRNTLKQVGAENLAKPYIVKQLADKLNKVMVKSEKRLINVYEEFIKNLDFVSKLRDSCHKWLQHPESENEFTILPRADEVDIVYLDYEDRDKQGNPKRKTESLQELLAKLEGTRYGDNAQFIKTVDLRELALKTVDRIDTTLDKFAKLGGLYVQDRANPETVALLTKSMTEAAREMLRARPVEHVRQLMAEFLPLNPSAKDLSADQRAEIVETAVSAAIEMREVAPGEFEAENVLHDT